MSPKILALIGVVALGAAAWWLLPERSVEAAPEIAEASAVKPPEAPTTPPAQVVEMPDPATNVAPPPEDRVVCPDGTWVESLNGVKGATTLPWPKEIPYARVVRKQFHVDRWWYVHEDGSWSTTFNAVQPDGTVRSFAHVANPVPAVPRLDSPDVPRMPGGESGAKDG